MSAPGRGAYTTRVLKTPSTVCDAAFSEEIVPFAAEILGAENVRPVPPMKGAEDFGHVTRLVPGFYAFMGAGSPEGYPLHNPNMVLDESAFALGAAILVNSAVGWLTRHAGPVTPRPRRERVRAGADTVRRYHHYG